MQKIKVQENLDGKRYIVMESNRLDMCLTFAAQNQSEIPGILISRAKGYCSDSLDFLKQTPWVKWLIVVDDYKDASPVASLSNLEHLQSSLSSPVDFTNLNKMQVYRGNWYTSNESFYTLKNLNTLALWGRGSSTDINRLRAFEKLRHLELTELSTDHLDGIESLTSLQFIGVYFCRKLQSIEGIKALKNIKEANFEGCKKVSSFAPLSENHYLKKLIIEKCGEIADLDFLSTLHELESLFFWGTTIKSNDLSPILKCRSLQLLGFNDKKTYSHTKKELQKALGITSGN